VVVKPGLAERLEASVATATKLAEGLVVVAVVGGAEHLYSQKFACPECGTSIPQLEPRSFSFNSPFGACEQCHGLGNKWSFDAGKLLVDPGRPLLDGAMGGPGSSSSSAVSAVEAYAKRAKIKIEKPFDTLPAKQQSALMDGADGFPGVLKLLDEAYEHANEGHKEWLFESMSPTQCPACKGARLKPSSLAVRVKGSTIGDFVTHGLGRARELAAAWQLDPRERQIAGRRWWTASSFCVKSGSTI
jgi:excinuclease ABC subunit A